MRNSVFLIIILAMLGCSNATSQKGLKNTREELIEVQEKIEKTQSQTEPEGQLVHLVFFKLKPKVDQAAVLEEIKKLEAIEGLKDFKAGPYEDLGDARSLAEYDMMMEMSFDNRDAYKVYQTHPIHLALKEAIQPLLAAPPATFDYIKK